MKYKHIQAAHELRMWILTIGMGIAAASKLMEKHPEIKESVTKRIEKVKSKFENNEEEEVIKVVVIREEKES